MSNIQTELRKNLFWPEIKKVLNEFGYQHYTPEKRASGSYDVCVETTGGARRYPFPRSAQSFRAVPNFVSKFKRWVREDLLASGYAPIPDPTDRTRRPGLQVLKQPYNVPTPDAPSLAPSPETSQSPEPSPLRSEEERSGADSSTPPEQAETFPQSPPATPSQATQEAAVKDTVTVKDAPMKPKDLRVVFSIATEDLPTVLGVLTGIATFISAGPLDGRESREQVVPASPAILAPIPSPSVSVPRAAVPKSPNHASFNRTKQRGGLRIYDWLLLRMLESDELTGEELGTALVQVGYAATSASPTLTALERNELVEVVKRGRKSRIRLTPHGKREGERLASLMGGSYTQIVSGVR